MPSKSEKQRKFFGAVMGAKKGKGKVTGAAKKAAKEMPEKEIKKFLKKESYDDLVNAYLKMHLIESDMGTEVRMDPREQEGITDEPEIDDYSPLDNEISHDEMVNAVIDAFEAQSGNRFQAEVQAHNMSPEEVKQAYYYIQKDPSMGAEEEEMSNTDDMSGGEEMPTDEDCEDGCQCERCKGSSGGKMLNFYGFTK